MLRLAAAILHTQYLGKRSTASKFITSVRFEARTTASPPTLMGDAWDEAARHETHTSRRKAALHPDSPIQWYAHCHLGVGTRKTNTCAVCRAATAHTSAAALLTHRRRAVSICLV